MHPYTESQTGRNDPGAPLRLHLPALPENVAVVRAAVGESAVAYGLAGPVIDDLKTVVTEACANVVLHAYPGSGDPGPLEVEMSREPTGVKVVVRDRGLGIWPRPESSPASLRMGLLLIGALSSSFQLKSGHDVGTELSMDLALSACG